MEGFGEQSPGRCVDTSISDNSVQAFIPSPLPPNRVDWGSLTPLISEVSYKMGKLSSKLENRTDVPMSGLHVQEAATSLQIEGIDTSVSEVAAARSQVTDRVTFVSDEARTLGLPYVTALESSYTEVTTDLVQELHANLFNDLSEQRKEEILPGKFRDIQNFIGSKHRVRYVPSPPKDVPLLIDSLTKYLRVRQQRSIPVVVALAHYQFEAIHPFIDGNGRVGRLLIPALFDAYDYIPQNVLGLSPFFKRRRQKYYRHLLAVSRDGAWEDWLEFCLDGLSIQCTRVESYIESIDEVKDEFLEVTNELPESRRIVALKLLDTPFITPQQASVIADCSDTVGYDIIGDLADCGVLRQCSEKQRNTAYYCPDVLDVWDDYPFTY